MAKQKKASQINDLIFKELIKRGYALEGKTRVWNIADSKLWYLTPEQSQAFLDLEKSKDYQKEIISKELDLINENIDEIIEELGNEPINVIDLGCGDGKKAVIFLDKIRNQLKSKRGVQKKVRYCPIDISGYMVEKALNRIKETDIEEVTKFQWNISDFENIENVASVLRYGDYKKNLFLLLGNTLGNFEINELLYEIRSGMESGDMLVIGNGLDNRHPKDILKAYTNPQVHNFLKHIPLQLGLKEDEIEFGTRFQNSRVELLYTVKKEKVIEFNQRKLILDEGDQLLVSVSYKYTSDDFKSFLKMYFTRSEIFTSKDNSYGLALCKK
jgi:uncharacterized SAM-dependent methyltransferase